jgi:hypothetical protein
LLLRITSDGKTAVIDQESLEALEKHEKHLEDWLSLNLDRLIDRIQLWTIKQERPAKSEADIVALDSEGNTYIFELKRGEARHRAVGQLFNYWTAIAEMKYDELQKFARDHYKKETLDLSFEHYKHFNLTRKIENEKFNKDSRLIVVAEKANENLWKMIAFLRERYKVPIGFVKYETYRLQAGTANEIVVHFDTADVSELLNQITGEDESLLGEVYEESGERYFWYNTDKEHLEPQSIHADVFKMDIAATYGPPSYGEKLTNAKKGDWVFAYANGEGIRAYGKVIEKWNGKNAAGATKSITHNKKEEYHLPVHWEKVLTKENAIKPDEIRALGYNNFRGTFRRIYNIQFSKKLKDEISSRQPSN